MPRASLRSVLLICAFSTARESAEKPLRQRPGFQSDPLEVIAGVRQHRQQCYRFARHLRFPHDPARVIHDADTCFLDRNVQSSKMVHAVLLLLMLEAANADLVSPSALSAAPTISSDLHAGGPITPSVTPIADIHRSLWHVR